MLVKSSYFYCIIFINLGNTSLYKNKPLRKCNNIIVLGAVKEEGTEGAESKPNLVVLLMSLLNSEVSIVEYFMNSFTFFLL